jgi:prevent-host-death family protein
MVERTWSMRDAKNQFRALVKAARRKPQFVIEHGKPAVVVVDAAQYERLSSLQRAEVPSLADVLLAMPQDGGEFSRDRVRMRR